MITWGRSYFPRTHLILTPGVSFTLPGWHSTTLCSWRLWPSPRIWSIILLYYDTLNIFLFFFLFVHLVFIKTFIINYTHLGQKQLFLCRLIGERGRIFYSQNSVSSVFWLMFSSPRLLRMVSHLRDFSSSFASCMILSHAISSTLLLILFA